MYTGDGNVKIGAAPMESSMEVPLKVSRITILLNSSTLEYISTGTKMRMFKQCLYSHVRCSVIHNRKDVKAT